MVQSCQQHPLNAHSSYPVGIISPDNLLEEQTSFLKSYDAFTLSDDDKNKVKQWPASLTFNVFFGAWCHDSEREVPKLIKVLENYQSSSARYIALDITKSDPQNLSQLAKVKYTPTIIVYLSGKEIGRIIERPKVSIIDDIDNMLIQ